MRRFRVFLSVLFLIGIAWATTWPFLNLDDVTTGWQLCAYTESSPSFCAAGDGIPTAINQTFNNATPSVDGGSMMLQLVGPESTNVGWYQNLGANDSATYFVLDMQFYINQNVNTINALEFDQFQYILASSGQVGKNTRLYMGTQCVYNAGNGGDWEIWNSYSSTGGSGSWVDTGTACTLTASGWHHLVESWHRVPGDTSGSGGYPKMYADSGVLDGTTLWSGLMTSGGALPTGWSEQIGVMIQQDSSLTSTCSPSCTLTEYVDELNETLLNSPPSNGNGSGGGSGGGSGSGASGAAAQTQFTGSVSVTGTMSIP